MVTVKRSLLFIGLLAVSSGLFSQELSQYAAQLSDYCKHTAPTGYSPNLNRLTLTPKNNLHYLYPFYHAFRDEAKFRKIYTDKGYCEELSQYFAFAGDYQTAMFYLEKSYDSIDDATRRKVFHMIEGVKDIRQADARKYIHYISLHSQVIMINEAYAKPQHRAFTMSLLADLYRQGFRYLAMEMLSNFASHTLTSLTMNTGYYASEPVAGEMIRAALAIGYTLVAYEDTLAASHTPGQRDSIQAQNIYAILQKDPAAKILVHAAYAHISKKQGPDGYIPMGLIFKNISGVDPITIDQTDMTEESNFGYGRVLYQAYLREHPVTTPSIALLNNQPVNVTNNDLYDFSVIHPPTSYLSGRPTWLSLGGLRKPFYVKPSSPATYFVQAYYQDEYQKNNNKPWQLVPADQTYVEGGKNSYLLYLQKGKYIIFFRDMDYHTLSTLPIEVN